MRRLPDEGFEVRGLDLLGGPHVDVVGSITDPHAVREALDGVDGVIHAATLHKPHLATHTKQQFLETNVTGTQMLLDGAVAAGVQSFVFTSTTSAFGSALVDPDAQAATWIDERVVPQPKNIYGTSKRAAEDLCELAHREHGLPVVVLRTSRFFPEPDDLPERARAFDDLNLKVVELLHRRVDLEDLVGAHTAALAKAPADGFRRYVATATTPFRREDVDELGRDAAAVILRRCRPETAAVFADRGWRLPVSIDRVYANDLARSELPWQPQFTFDHAVGRLARGEDPRSAVTVAVGSKGYGV